MFKLSEPFKESLKELLRVVMIALVPNLILYAEQGYFDVRALALTAAIAGLRFVDKLLHLEGKESGNENLEKGLTRF